MTGPIRDLLALGWSMRWCALCCLLFWYGQAEPWPWTVVQVLADLFLTGMIAWASRWIWREARAARYGQVAR